MSAIWEPGDIMIWHPYLGGTKEQSNTTQPKIPAKVARKIPAATWHRYANEMVDKPYNRFGITYDVQSRIMSTLILRKQ